MNKGHSTTETFIEWIIGTIIVAILFGVFLFGADKAFDNYEKQYCFSLQAQAEQYKNYLYSLQKKERKNIAGSKHGETKNIMLSFNISDNDMLTKVIATEKFLNKGDKVNVELRLKGREKQLSNVGLEKIKKFIKLLEEKIPIKIEKEIKKEPKGLSVTILKK
jgi:hypothetical protein